jgi:LexA-binding, inner membrane-associated putative hydrolase
MFLGHHAAGFAAKTFAPRVSLGTLFAAAMLLDLVWPLLLIAGVEHVRIDPGNTAFTPLDFYDYPITHSLLMVLGWSALFAILYRVVRKAPWRDAIVLGIVVLSHWVLDFITHRPDLPLWPSGPMAGLGLWSSVAGTVIVEAALFLIALRMYLRATRAIDRTGTIALWALVVFVALIYVANITSPPPPDARMVGFAALAAWLFVPWGYWIDRHREPRT